jgi:hypothetical protein
LDNLAEQGAAFMLKVFVKPTNEVPDLRGCAPGRFSDAQIMRKPEDASSAVLGF